MNIISGEELGKTHRIYIPEGTIIEETLLRMIKYKKLNEVYREHFDKDPVSLINSLLDELELKYELPEEDLENIPPEGSFITVSNQPYRGLDSLLLFKIISGKRNDFKIMANFVLRNVEPLNSIILPVNSSETQSVPSSFSGLKEGIIHLMNQHCLGMFPAGETTAQYETSQIILDREWQNSAIKFIKNAHVPVIPVYFHGTQSRLFYIFRKINPLWRLADLPSEILNKKNRIVRVRIGNPVTVKEQAEFRDISQYGRYIRSRTYLLGSTIEPKRFFNLKPAAKKKLDAEPLDPPVPAAILRDEFNSVRSKFELFTTKNYSVICAPTIQIPQTIREIGRLRELTFRQVGEGTNKSSDIDEFDLYYNHLFIWDTEADRIVGAYRIGKGRDITALYGIKGFYINSLFKIKKEFIQILEESLELGRSFIVKEYQKKAMPLFLLWKGIMVFLLRNQEYRYLIGPVSISNDFSRFSKNLIVSFIRAYFFNDEKAGFIIPRKNFVVRQDKVVDQKIFIDVADRDINKIERIIMNIEPGYRIPVLLRKYLEINGQIIGFNIDPKFNDCLDGLLILDLYNLPPDYIRGLSREMNDESIFERFRI